MQQIRDGELNHNQSVCNTIVRIFLLEEENWSLILIFMALVTDRQARRGFNKNNYKFLKNGCQFFYNYCHDC